jgi:replication factor A2
MDYQGGGGGGGFGASQGSGSRGGAGRGGGGRRNYDEQTLIPVTVGMVLSSSDDGEGSGNLMLRDGRKLSQIKLVGAVRQFNDYSTNVVYEIEDGTGLVEVKQWIDDGDCTAMSEMRQEALKDNIYVSIVGSVKEYDGKKTIIADFCRPLVSGNQLTHHLLEVVYASHMYKQKDSIIPGGVVPMVMGTPGQNSYTRQTEAGGGVRESVLALIRDESNRVEIGASIFDCIKRFSGRFSEMEVRQTVHNLCAEGHLYSTVDDDHFKFAM